jgi:lipoyl(octanoyl) transferase
MATIEQAHADVIPMHWLGRQPYLPLWQQMKVQAATMADDPACAESIWLCEHEVVYTTGKRGCDNRLHATLPAPFYTVDRGGETTFHGPGQIMLYPFLRLRARGLGVRDYVHVLEESCIRLLADYGTTAHRRDGCPGVWLDEGKIAAMGVRVSRGISYHGMALNIQVNDAYFRAINPCGLGCAAVSLYSPDTSVIIDLPSIAQAWHKHLQTILAD